MRDNNIISILDVLLTETTLVTKANPGSVRIWDRYRRGPRFVRILDWSNLGPPQRRHAQDINGPCITCPPRLSSRLSSAVAQCQSVGFESRVVGSNLGHLLHCSSSLSWTDDSIEIGGYLCTNTHRELFTA